MVVTPHAVSRQKGEVMSPCAGILLAGGQSRRMGQDKAMLPFGSEPLGARLFRLLDAACAEVVVIRDPELGFPVPGARLVSDHYPERGPMEGIASGLEAINSDRALVMACDMPFVSRAIVDRLCTFAPEAPAVVPRGPRGLEPLLAVYSRALLPDLRRHLEGGERRIQRLLPILGYRELPYSELTGLDPELRSFWNLNDPEAYHLALQALAASDQA